ncbi:MAG: Threonylcarbamoyl-AMP synthase [Chlamydiae bacterium]|nr:Threonylcarbamoyl-AMP synthase [Chlamydiota bacterium]
MHMTEKLKSNPSSIKQAANYLKNGKVIAFPTETVYGLGALLSCPQAMGEIFHIKNRPANKPLMAHISSLEMLSFLDILPPELLQPLVGAFLPGPLAIILPRGDGSTLGIRMPSHPVALALIEAVGEPIMATSANLSGQPSLASPEEILEALGGKIAAVLDGGPASSGTPSTILSLASERPTLLRSGPISQAMLEEVLGLPILCA